MSICTPENDKSLLDEDGEFVWASSLGSILAVTVLGDFLCNTVHFMDCENSRVSECPLDLLELTRYWKLILWCSIHVVI